MSVLDLSDPKHMRAEARLGSEPIVWLTTVTPDGRAQSTPVWFYWDGDSFLVYSQAGRAKLRNLAANPHVSLHLEGDGAGGENVIFEGMARIVPDGPPAHAVQGYIEKYRGRIDQYGWTPESFSAVYSVAVRITPTRARIW